jgi:hypothetical protein
LRGIKEVFNNYGAVMLRRTQGAEPFDAIPLIAWAELYDYLEQVLNLAFEAAHSGEATVAQEALRILPEAVSDYTMRARPDRGVKMFERLVGEGFSSGATLNIAELAAALSRAISGLSSSKNDNTQHLEGLRRLLTRIEEGSFESRLKRWCGGWEYEHTVNGKGEYIYRADTEIERLASEAAEKPGLLDDTIINWLVSPEAKRAFEFMYQTGVKDKDRKVLSLAEGLGESEGGQTLFAGYMGGLASWRPGLVTDRLDRLAKDGRVRPKALAMATRFIPGDAEGVKRIQYLIERNGLDPEFAERTLSVGGWMKTLSSEEAHQLLASIAGKDLKYASAVVDFLAMWVHGGQPLDGKLEELAWACFETAPEVQWGEAYDFDVVAAALAKKNPERAFVLLDRLLHRPYQRDSWSPMDRFSGKLFWDVLWERDRTRVLEIVLAVAAEDPLQRWRVAWHMPDMLDQEKDADQLVNFALKDEQNAKLIAETITGKKQGFWPIAIKILAQYPDSESLQGAIAGGAQQINQVIVGPASQHLSACADQAQKVLEDPSTPESTKPFLIRLVKNLRAGAELEAKREIDESVNF